MSDEQPITVADFMSDEPETGQPVAEQLEGDTGPLPTDEVEPEPEVIDLADDDGAEQPELEPEPELEPVKPPVSWSKEDIELFNKLPREQQEVIARREGERDKFVREAGRKAKETEVAVSNQAREVIAQQAELHSIALQTYAQQLVASPPDQSLLYTGDPNDVLTYQRQDAAYRVSASQQHQLQQAIAESQRQALLAREQAQSFTLQAESERLREQLPEWFDPSEGQKLRENLQTVATELGYTPELMSQANAGDILALKTASEWKAKASKYDALMKARMTTVRSAKDRPQMARPGIAPTKSARAAESQNRRGELIQQFSQTRSGEAAAGLLLERRR